MPGRPAAREDRVRVSVRKAAERFRLARDEAGLTLRALAEKAGLAPSTIQKIESSKLIPSLSVCIRLADALHRPISYFAEDGIGPAEVRRIGRGRGRVTHIREMPIVMEHVAEQLVHPKMEAFLVTVGPRGKSGPEEPIVYRGEEIVIGVKGRIRFSIRGQDYVVGPGDVLHLKGDLPHFWENPTARPAQMYMVCAFAYAG